MKKTTAVIICTASAFLFALSCAKKTNPVQTASVENKTTTPVSPMVSVTNVAEGEKIYNSSCGRCHDLKDPATYTVAEWRPIMEKMADKAHLTTEQKTNALAYVIRNAKSGK